MRGKIEHSYKITMQPRYVAMVDYMYDNGYASQVADKLRVIPKSMRSALMGNKYAEYRLQQIALALRDLSGYIVPDLDYGMIIYDDQRRRIGRKAICEFKKRKVTVGAIAAILGVKQGTVGGWFDTYSVTKDFRTLRRLAELAQMSDDDLLKLAEQNGNHRRKAYQHNPNRPVSAATMKRSNICWDCARACGACSWSSPKHIPVKGWTAKPVVYKCLQTYHITACPKFIADAMYIGQKRIYRQTGNEKKRMSRQLLQEMYRNE